MKGIIFVNPFLTTKQIVHQAERIKEEFVKRGVYIDIVSDGYMRVAVDGKGANVDLVAPNFAVYLDKDKYLSEVLERGGLRLFNRHNAVRVCDDKAQTYIALMNNGLKFPKTIFGALCYNSESVIDKNAALIIGEKLGYPVVIKESFGSLGKGVYIANNVDELFAVMQKVKLKPHLFQQYIGYRKGTDVRVIVIGGKVVAAMERHNDNDFRSNIALGGSGKEIKLSQEFKNAAEKCAQVLGLDYCGVDLLYGEDGCPYVCEVNSNAFFDGVESVTGVNVAGAYAEHILNTINSK